LKTVGVVLGVLFTLILGSTAFVDWSFKGGLHLTPRFSTGDFLEALKGNIDWLLVFVLLSTSMLPLRAIQWQSTLRQPVPFRERWHFVNIGALVHNVIPGNLGDVTRGFLLARTQQLPVVVGLGSVAMCKLLELVTLILLAAAAMLLPFWSGLPQLGSVLRVGVAVCGGLTLVTLSLARFSRPLAGHLPMGPRWNRIKDLLLEVDGGLRTARSARGLGWALFLSFPPNIVASLAYGVGLTALGVKHGLAAGPLVLLLIALGKGTAGMPTGPGMYFLVASWFARALGVPAQDAAAYALLTNVATGVSHWIPGVISLVMRRVHWSELRQQTSLAAEAARGVKSPPAPARKGIVKRHPVA
jgi:hypothetical protein